MFIESVLKSNLSWPSGSRAAYSSIAYILLGYALEKVTGDSYQGLMAKRILQPLGLNSTSFIDPPLKRGIIPTGMQYFSSSIAQFNAYVTTQITVHAKVHPETKPAAEKKVR